MSSPVREDRDVWTAGAPVGVPTPRLESYVEKGEALKAYKREAAPKMSSPNHSVRRSQEENLVDRRRVQAW